MFCLRIVTVVLVAIASTMCTAVVYRDAYATIRNEIEQRNQMQAIEGDEEAPADNTVPMEKENL